MGALAASPMGELTIHSAVCPVLRPENVFTTRFVRESYAISKCVKREFSALQ